jgi:hypothetical protein
VCEKHGRRRAITAAAAELDLILDVVKELKDFDFYRALFSRSLFYYRYEVTKQKDAYSDTSKLRRIYSDQARERKVKQQQLPASDSDGSF